MNLPNLNYVTITEDASAQVCDVLENEPSLQRGGSYLALGFLGMQDAIVLVDSDGKVVTLPYDEQSYQL